MEDELQQSKPHIKVQGKRGKKMSATWFNCKQRVAGRVTSANIACSFRIQNDNQVLPNTGHADPLGFGTKK